MAVTTERTQLKLKLVGDWMIEATAGDQSPQEISAERDFSFFTILLRMLVLSNEFDKVFNDVFCQFDDGKLIHVQPPYALEIVSS